MDPKAHKARVTALVAALDVAILDNILNGIAHIDTRISALSTMLVGIARHGIRTAALGTSLITVRSAALNIVLDIAQTDTLGEIPGVSQSIARACKSARWKSWRRAGTYGARFLSTTVQLRMLINMNGRHEVRCLTQLLPSST